MEQDGKLEESVGDTAAEKKSRYCVLYTPALKQWRVTETLKTTLPKGMGEVFYPCREIWWKGLNKIVFRPLFPGYVFIRSEIGKSELHEYIRQSRGQVMSFVKELKLNEDRAAGGDFFDGSDIFDLTDEEAEFFDMILGFKFDAELDERLEKAAKDGKDYKPAQVFGADGEVIKDNSVYAGLSEEEKTAAAQMRRREKKVPEHGIAQMSYGYLDGKKRVIMDGPLRHCPELIEDVDVKENLAFMRIKINGKPTKMGLKILGKRLWYPNDRKSPDVLADGTVVDCDALSRAMSSGGIKMENDKKQKHGSKR